MKKILLLGAVALMAMTATAQQQRSAEVKKTQRSEVIRVKPTAPSQEMQMRTPGTPVAKAPKKAGTLEPYYHRPAGAFPGNNFMNADGTWGGASYTPYLCMKPYTTYTYTGVCDGASADAEYWYNVQQYGYDENGVRDQYTYRYDGQDVDVTYTYEVDDVPEFHVKDGDKEFSWYYRGHKMKGTDIEEIQQASIMAAPSADQIFSDVEEGGGIIVSSKTFSYGGLSGTCEYPFIYYSGMDPYGRNQNGWWFGKNGGTVTREGETRVLRLDGIAQAFEKPTAPYLLRSVYLDCALCTILSNRSVTMTCKIYKLDEIPAYDSEKPVYLPEEPGELIATGRATITAADVQATNNYIRFNIFDYEDGLEVEYTPTIDFPILVVIDGYNDPEMANLSDFSALVGADELWDEGFGELAYLKRGVNDEDGNFTGRYVYEGLNNFFASGEMKTGFSILLDIENPFLTFNYNIEDGEFTFPNEGGLMEKVLFEEGDQKLVTRSIEFYSWTPSVDEGWTLTCNGEDVPSWLDIELIDEEKDGEFTGGVTAMVTAEPLPEDVDYREAVVRFEFPGAYLDYKFMQGVPVDPQFDKFDVNHDKEVNVADVNYLINMILTQDSSSIGDVNGDLEVNIADVNALIDRILNQ